VQADCNALVDDAVKPRVVATDGEILSTGFD